jgi:hypothetical protein
MHRDTGFGDPCFLVLCSVTPCEIIEGFIRLKL